MLQAPLLICLEGPDTSGKTTLANAIRSAAIDLGMRVHSEHCGYTKFKDRINTYHTAALWRCLKSGADLAILDRWWMSEEIYAHVYRGGTPWPQSGRFLDRVFLRFNGIYVVCAPNSELSFQRAKARKADELYWEKNAQVGELYREMTTASRLKLEYPKTNYGYLFTTNRSRDDVFHYDRDLHLNKEREYARFVLNAASWHRINAKKDPVSGTVLNPYFFNLAGKLTAPTAMVGDVTNSKLRNQRLSWPFFEHANCSLYLANALQKAKIREDSLLWFNANGETVPFMPSGHTVALGQLAATWLEGRKFESYARVPHPQYARRFNYHDLENYADLLTQAIKTTPAKVRSSSKSRPGEVEDTQPQL